MVAEIVAEMDYLRTREQKLRDTNESTNNRVKWFAFSTMGMLVALGAWQVVYLRAYFRYGGIRQLKDMHSNHCIGQSILFRSSARLKWAGVYGWFLRQGPSVLVSRKRVYNDNAKKQEMHAHF